MLRSGSGLPNLGIWSRFEDKADRVILAPKWYLAGSEFYELSYWILVLLAKC